MRIMAWTALLAAVAGATASCLDTARAKTGAGRPPVAVETSVAAERDVE